MKRLNTTYILLMLFAIVILLFIIFDRRKVNEKMRMIKSRNEGKPFGLIWEKCHNGCYNIFDQARFEICKEKCNNKFLL